MRIEDRPPSDGAPDQVVDDAVRRIAEEAAQAVAVIEHHREELRRTMAELTALQRQVRVEALELSALLDELAQATPSADAEPEGRARPRKFRR